MFMGVVSSFRQFFPAVCFNIYKVVKVLIFMTYSVNQKINSYNQPQMGAMSPSANLAGAPSMSANGAVAEHAEKVKQSIAEKPVTQAAQRTNPALMAGIFLPTWALTHIGMKKFGESCRGEYKDTMLGKIGGFGEKIGSKPIFNGPAAKKVQGFYNKIANFVNREIIDSSPVLKAMFRTPTKPENPMVNTMKKGIEGEVASTVTQFFDKYTESGAKLDKVVELGFKKADGTADVEAYKKFIKESHENVDEILKKCQAMGKDAFHQVEKGGKIPLTGWIYGKGNEKYLSEVFPSTKKFFTKKTYFSEFENKLIAAKGSKYKVGPYKTALGKGLPRFALRVIEGFTNAGSAGGGGAMLASLMGAFFIADSAIRAVKAPKGKGEKTRTFAENMIYGLGFYLTMPLGLKMMHGVGGLKYIGMTPEQVEQYRTKLKAFNAKADANGFANKAEWKKELKELKELLKGDTLIDKNASFAKKSVQRLKNMVYRPLKWAGRLLTIGIERTKAYLPKGANKAGTIFRNRSFYAKNAAGYAVRFPLFLFAISPFLAKFFAKGSHMVFGKPQHSILDEGKEDEAAKAVEKKAQIVQPAVYPQPAMHAVQSPQGMNMVQSSNNVEKQNMLNMNNAQTSSAKNMIPTDEKPKRRYIPSSDGVKLNNTTAEDDKAKKLFTAEQKAENATAQAMRLLGE